MRTQVLRISLAVTVALLLTDFSPADATQVVHHTPRQMSRTADLVVRGHVVSVQSFWNAEHTRILTETTIAVREQLKGRNVTDVRILQVGGVVDDVRMTVAGALAWTPGEDVLLFLEPSLDGRHRVAGFNQGKYHVRRDPRTGLEYVSQAPLGDTRLVGTSRAASEGGPLLLEDFLESIHPFMMGEE